MNWVGDGVKNALDFAKNPLESLSIDHNSFGNPIGYGDTVGSPILQYPSTLGAKQSETMYESDPEKNKNGNSTLAAHADVLIEGGSDPFITFTFNTISTTMKDVEKRKMVSHDLIKGVLYAGGVSGATNIVANVVGGNDRGMVKTAGDTIAGAAAAYTILDAVSQMSKTVNSKPLRHATSRIALYMPPSIQVSDSADWSITNNKPLAMAAEAKKAMTDKDGNFKWDPSTWNAGGSASIAASAMAGETLMGGGLLAGAASSLGITNMAGAVAFGGAIKLVGDEELRLLGKAINPNEYLQYNSVRLREFSLNFKFLPDSVKESQDVEKIIKQFRAAMYPIKHDNISMTVPDMLNLEFHNTKGMVKMPDLALTNVNITYNPNSSSFFKVSGSPVEITMAIQLQEIYPMHRDLVEKEGY